MTTENLACTVKNKKMPFITENNLGLELRCSGIVLWRMPCEGWYSAEWTGCVRNQSHNNIMSWNTVSVTPGNIIYLILILFFFFFVPEQIETFYCCQVFMTTPLSSVLSYGVKDWQLKKRGSVGSACKKESAQEFPLGSSWETRCGLSIQKGEAKWERGARCQDDS